MNEFLLLISQLLFIAILQTIIESFIEDKSKLRQFINVACILGSLYFLLQYAFNHLLNEVNSIVKFPF